MNIPRSELAWAAGMLEGEGWIGIDKPTHRNIGALYVSVTNTDIEIIRFFQERWPGCHKPVSGKGPNRKPASAWTVAALKAVAFLQMVRPYLRTTRTRRRTRLALAFQHQKLQARKTQGRAVFRQVYRDRQWRYYRAMRRLNQRGKSRKEMRTEGSIEPARRDH